MCISLSVSLSLNYIGRQNNTHKLTYIIIVAVVVVVIITQCVLPLLLLRPARIIIVVLCLRCARARMHQMCLQRTASRRSPGKYPNNIYGYNGFGLGHRLVRTNICLLLLCCYTISSVRSKYALQIAEKVVVGCNTKCL